MKTFILLLGLLTLNVFIGFNPEALDKGNSETLCYEITEISEVHSLAQSKQYCFNIVCSNSNHWYELSPKAPSYSQARRLMENKYKNCSVRQSAMRNCR